MQSSKHLQKALALPVGGKLHLKIKDMSLVLCNYPLCKAIDICWMISNTGFKKTC